MIKVSEKLNSNVYTYTQLGLNALEMIATIPEEQREDVIQNGVANKMMKISETHYLNYSHASNLITSRHRLTMSLIQIT